MKYAEEIVKEIEKRGPIDTTSCIVDKDDTWEDYIRGIGDRKMGRLIDADVLREEVNSWGMNDYEPSDFTDAIDDAPTVEAIPKDQINKAIEKIEQYICDVEIDTVKAQGMAQALDMFEQALGEDEDGKD